MQNLTLKNFSSFLVHCIMSEANESRNLTLFVKTLNGELIQLDCSLTDSVSELKTRVQQQMQESSSNPSSSTSSSNRPDEPHQFHQTLVLINTSDLPSDSSDPSHIVMQDNKFLYEYQLNEESIVCVLNSVRIMIFLSLELELSSLH